MKHVVVNIFHTNKRKSNSLRSKTSHVTMTQVKTTFSAGVFITQFCSSEMSINYVNLPNNECFMIHSITNGFKSTFPLPQMTKIPLEAWRFAFFSSFLGS